MEERGLRVHSLNPKQLDRFRDRFFPAGQKDDRRDAWVPANSLRTDPQAFRLLQIPPGAVLELGEVTEGWILEQWEAAPTPEEGRRLRRPRIGNILRRNRIRRVDVGRVKEVLSRKAIDIAPGTERAASERRLVQRQLRDLRNQIEALIEVAHGNGDDEEPGQRDSDILRSIPGVGATVLATLLAEAFDPIKRRDYRSLRALSGVAPITQRSGKSIIVKRRHAANKRLRNAVWHMSRVAIQHDRQSRCKYDALRARGHRHARALRSVGDRLLYVACAMLRDGTLYQPALRSAAEAA
jgi:hypothetical protein